jgi:glycosyltransferase involved in cell wall biosynthesis
MIRAVRRARIVGVAGGDPWNQATSSGRARNTFAALRDRDRLVGAIAGRPHWLEPLEKASAVSRDRERWKQRFFAAATPAGPLSRAVSEAVATQRIKPLLGEADAVLQVTGWFSVGRAARRAGALHALYLDTVLARYLERSDLAFAADEWGVRRSLGYERDACRQADVVLTVSDWVRSAVIERYGADPGAVATVGIGANVAGAHPPLDRDWTVPRILFVGFAWERKGGPELLAAFRRVRGEHPEAELTIVGPPPGAPEPGVTWTGRIDRSLPEGEARLRALHVRATIFCLPSRYEPFGNAVVQAMHYGLALVVSDAGGIAEAVEPGVSGLVVPPLDPDALAEALLSLAGAPERARAMGAAAASRARSGGFTWDAVAERIVAEVEARL